MNATVSLSSTYRTKPLHNLYVWDYAIMMTSHSRIVRIRHGIMSNSSASSTGTSSRI